MYCFGFYRKLLKTQLRDEKTVSYNGNTMIPLVGDGFLVCLVF